MNDANLAQQEVQDNTDFLVGDVVVLKNSNLHPQILTIEAYQPKDYY